MNPNIPLRQSNKRLELVGDLLPRELLAAAAAAPLERTRTKLERLEELERELRLLLSGSAPATWLAMRGTLFRLIRRARRELRAAERLEQRAS